MTKFKEEMFVSKNSCGCLDGEWDFVTITPFLKNEYKNTEAEKGIIFSYANAVNSIATDISEQNHDYLTTITLRINSLTIPFIFLARHTVELALKYLCNVLNIELKPKHNLMPLWEEILAELQTNSCVTNKELNGVTVFIRALEKLDDDGTHARYAKNNKGSLYFDTPLFINVKNINNFIQVYFVKLVKSI